MMRLSFAAEDNCKDRDTVDFQHCHLHKIIMAEGKTAKIQDAAFPNGSLRGAY